MLAFVGVGVGAAQWASWPYTVDDAFVLARYARRIAGGLGYTMREGPPTDGLTGPVGVIVPALASSFGGDPLLAAKIVGAASSLVGAAVIVARAASVSRAMGWITAATIVACGWIAIWSVAGLETGIATCLFCVVGAEVFVAEGEARARRGASTLILLAVIPWLRPELTIAAAGLALWAHLQGDDRARGWIGGVALGVGVLSVALFRLALFGSPLPMSVLAKPAELTHGLSYAARSTIVLGALLWPLGVAIARRLPGAWIVLAHVIAVVFAGGDWMPGLRLIVPILPFVALVIAEPLAELLSRRRGVGLALLAVGLIVPAVLSGLGIARARSSAEYRARSDIAQTLREVGGPVALVDVGAFAYPDLDVIDLGGITDPEVARSDGGHLDKRVSETWLRARSPRALLLHSRVPSPRRWRRPPALARGPSGRRARRPDALGDRPLPRPERPRLRPGHLLRRPRVRVSHR